MLNGTEENKSQILSVAITGETDRSFSPVYSMMLKAVEIICGKARTTTSANKSMWTVIIHSYI